MFEIRLLLKASEMFGVKPNGDGGGRRRNGLKSDNCLLKITHGGESIQSLKKTLTVLLEITGYDRQKNQPTGYESLICFPSA